MTDATASESGHRLKPLTPAMLRELSVRSDLRGAAQSLGHYGVIVLMGVLIWKLSSTWGVLWALPLMAVQGYVVAFLFMGGSPDGWSTQIFTVPMVSQQTWSLTAGDLMLVLGLLCLFLEIVKSTNTGRTSVLEHMLSTLVFVIFLVEFILVGAASSSVFFLLMVMSLFDVVAGFTVSITAAGRDVTMAG